MVAAAEEHTAGLRDCSSTNDVAELPVADYTVASGLFNVKLDLSVETWRSGIWDTVTVFHGHSSRAFAFNLLTAHSDPTAYGLTCSPPTRVRLSTAASGRSPAIPWSSMTTASTQFTTVVRREALQAAERRG